MKRVFADTCYLLALIGRHDEAHARARRMAGESSIHAVTTAWVVVEFLDALSRPPLRERGAQFLATIRGSRHVTIHPPSAREYESGLALYLTRPDKAWSLTDCISFAVMEELGLTEALTADRHFEQAGFVALMA